MTLEPRPGTTPIDGRTLAKRGFVTVLLSLGTNWIVLWAVLAVGLVRPFDALSVPPVTLLTVLGAVGATLAYGMITRLSTTPDRTFTVVALVVLVLSFLPDLAILQFDPAATAPAVAVLAVMHVTVATICILVLTGARSPISG